MKYLRRAQRFLPVVIGFLRSSGAWVLHIIPCDNDPLVAAISGNQKEVIMALDVVFKHPAALRKLRCNPFYDLLEGFCQ